MSGRGFADRLRRRRGPSRPWGKALALALRNVVSRSPVVDPATEVVVSMTTHGRRTRSVHLALESIGRGLERPGRLILWLADPVTLRRPGRPLERLVRRGLEIRSTENFGPHTKYFPYVEAHTGPFTSPLATGDDDMLYPRTWLRDLLDAYRAAPGQIHCYRAHRIGLDGTGLAPYSSWQPWLGGAPSALAFVTGVSGAIYPETFLEQLRALGRRFVDRTPVNDDVWLSWVALRTHHPVHQIGDEPRHFPTTPMTQSFGLLHSNVQGGGTDRCLARTYGPADIEALRALAASQPVSPTRHTG